MIAARPKEINEKIWNLRGSGGCSRRHSYKGGWKPPLHPMLPETRQSAILDHSS
jgi:hypothetical protein